MASTDYDKPRHRPEGDAEGEAMMSTVITRRSASPTDLGDDPDPFEADVTAIDFDTIADGLTIAVLPIQAGEFTCSACYLVCHPSQHSSHTRVCLDCAC